MKIFERHHPITKIDCWLIFHSLTCMTRSSHTSYFQVYSLSIHGMRSAPRGALDDSMLALAPVPSEIARVKAARGRAASTWVLVSQEVPWT